VVISLFLSLLPDILYCSTMRFSVLAVLGFVPLALSAPLRRALPTPVDAATARQLLIERKSFNLHFDYHH